LCVASNIRAMPENEKPPARRVDVYFAKWIPATVPSATAVDT